MDRQLCIHSCAYTWIVNPFQIGHGSSAAAQAVVVATRLTSGHPDVEARLTSEYLDVEARLTSARPDVATRLTSASVRTDALRGVRHHILWFARLLVLLLPVAVVAGGPLSL